MARAMVHNGELSFWCPGCNNMKTIPAERWHWDGNLDLPTLSPSINQRVGSFPDGHTDICHSIVTKGRISFCGDCTHSLVGKEVDIPELDTVIEGLVVNEEEMYWRRKV